MPASFLRALTPSAPISRPPTSDPAAIERSQAGDDFAKLALAIAVDTGDAQHLALPQLETQVVEGAHPAVIGGDEILGPEQDVAGRALHPLQVHDHVASDHAPCQLAGCRVLGVHFVRDFAVPHHRHPVGHLHDLLELVGDEQDRVVGGAQRFQAVEEGADLARRQHAGRFVKDENFGLAVERLQDLDALAHAHGQKSRLLPEDRCRSRSFD